MRFLTKSNGFTGKKEDREAYFYYSTLTKRISKIEKRINAQSKEKKLF